MPLVCGLLFRSRSTKDYHVKKVNQSNAAVKLSSGWTVMVAEKMMVLLSLSQ